MSDWKDEWREHKHETGLSWSEYHDRYFRHEDDIADLRAEVADLREQTEALAGHVRELRRNIGEVLILVEDSE